jgi:hypothetical protein
MTSKVFSCYACNGLLEQAFGNPVSELADWLNAETPAGIHFNDVGGFDPRPPVESQIQDAVVADIQAGKEVIFIGHSLGAMECYYLADLLNSKHLKAPLFVAIDPTQWGTNIPLAPPWDLAPPTPGQYRAPSNIAMFINFHQPAYPGGGMCVSGGQDITVPGVDHISIPNCNLVRQTILHAIGKLL